MFPNNYESIYSISFYLDKYLYLISKKLGGLYRYYTYYIDLELEDSKLNCKKRNFRRSCNNYEINNDLLLCFKYKVHYEKGNNHLIDRHKMKKEDEYELRIIPTVNNIIALLEKLYIEINHQCYLKLKSKIDDLKIYYKGIYKDMSNISHLCEVCIKKKIVFYKREPSKQIIMKKPKDRFTMDLTYLPVKIIEETNYKYLLNIIFGFLILIKKICY